jgi:UDP-N-acetylmuramate--alanine ligase
MQRLILSMPAKRYSLIQNFKMANEVNTFSKVYFLGIGGIGMSALARYFLNEGKKVAGYDRGDSDLTKELASEGCSICFLDDPSLIPESFMVKAEVLVVYTPAVKLDNLMLQYFMAHDFTIMKRAEVLGLITQIAKSLCVAGTHGKSTTSSLLAHILSCSSIKFNAFLGAIATNFNSNIVLQKEAEYVVVEADEFDRSFLQLSPFSAIVTSVDPDHLDIYGSKESFLDGFKQFANKIDSNGLLVIKEGLSLPLKGDSKSL